MDLFTQALALHANHRIEEAKALYQQVLAEQPAHARSLELLGVALAQTGDLLSGLEKIKQALVIAPNDPSILNNLGNLLTALGSYTEALNHLNKCIDLSPSFIDALNNRASTFSALNDPQSAIKDLKQALALDPKNTVSLYNLGVILQGLGSHREAIEYFKKAIQTNPSIHQIHSRLAISALKINQIKKAIYHTEKALTIHPHDLDNLLLKANLEQTLSKYDQAIKIYEDILSKSPNKEEARLGYAMSLMRTGRTQEGLHQCNQIIQDNPNNDAAFTNRASIKLITNDIDEAGIDLQKSLELNPKNPETWVALGALHAAKEEHLEALSCYSKALEIDPNSVESRYCTGLTLLNLQKYKEAGKQLEIARKSNPNLELVQGNIIQSKLSICDWNEIKEILSEAVKRLEKNEKSIHALQLMTLSDDQALLRQCASRFAPPQKAHTSRKNIKNHPNHKIKIAYISADYHTHPVAQLLIGLIKNHDRNKFHIIALSIDKLPDNEMRSQLRLNFDEFIEIQSKNNKLAAEIISANNVDILIDLNGLTQHCRPEIFTYKPAPIQASFLGFPCTSGNPSIDYIIGDKIVTPLHHKNFYTEKIAQLPHCYLPYNSEQTISSPPPTREQHQLSESQFVFCCFNNSIKINPESFKAWCDILKHVKNGVLWLKADNPDTRENLILAAENHGINADRLIFAKRTISHADHLARYQLADLFLDTSPYNAHTTASDAMWAGLPVLTRMGRSFSSRVAGSILTTLGMPELIQESWEDFVATAIRIGTTPGESERLKLKLAKQRESSALYDTRLYTKNLERLYFEMYQRHLAGESPQSFRLECNGQVHYEGH